jgi:pyruvate dehydrogenase E1 component
MLNPDKKEKIPYIKESLKDAKGVFIAASDYVKALPESVSKWVPGPMTCLGTDGFGRSDGRSQLRDFFEVDERYIVLAALSALSKEGHLKSSDVKKAIKDLDINPDKANPLVS